MQNTQYEEKPSEHDLLAMIACEMYLFRFKKSDLTLTAVALPNLSNSGRVRYNVNAQFKIQLISDFWWNISFYGNYDSRPSAGPSRIRNRFST